MDSSLNKFTYPDGLGLNKKLHAKTAVQKKKIGHYKIWSNINIYEQKPSTGIVL